MYLEKHDYVELVMVIAQITYSLFHLETHHFELAMQLLHSVSLGLKAVGE